MRIVAVMSPKGGVGKTTVAIGLAFALRDLGARVGLLDVDFHGPTLPVLLFGSDRLPRVEIKGKIRPVNVDGVRVFSLAFFVDVREPVMWTGKTSAKYVRAAFRDVDWGDADVLVVDTPPGMWDAQVEVMSMRESMIVLVTEPSLPSLYDAVKLVAAAGRSVVAVVLNEARPLKARIGAEEAARLLRVERKRVFEVPFNPELQVNPRRYHPALREVARLVLARPREG